MNTEACIPHPEYLIKSIAEQGYTLETSIADLIDNSISADARKIEILVNSKGSTYQLFICDDGLGMSEEELQSKMQFPSNSPENDRELSDLGRFGLGLKTASFSQTRCFTVISKKRDETEYSARTWDVNHLKIAGWEIIINSPAEVDAYLSAHGKLSNGFLNPFVDYVPNTLVVWNGLYKFENQQLGLEVFHRELEKVKEHLQLIFHRFMERSQPVQIRLNNEILIPFNPFPARARQIPVKQKTLLNDRLKLEGYVLPNISLKESKNRSDWTLADKSLMDMEGMYIYRADRLIAFGGWNGIVRKSPRLQLARLKVEIGNSVDHLFHLNVAKSSITVPYGERIGFLKYISLLKLEAEKEYFNVAMRHVPSRSSIKNLFIAIPTNQGMAVGVDPEFPLLKDLRKELNGQQQNQLSIILRMMMTQMNRIKKVHADESYADIAERESIDEHALIATIELLQKNKISNPDILTVFIPAIGVTVESLPFSILSLLK